MKKDLEPYSNIQQFTLDSGNAPDWKEVLAPLRPRFGYVLPRESSPMGIFSSAAIFRMLVDGIYPESNQQQKTLNPFARRQWDPNRIYKNLSKQQRKDHPKEKFEAIKVAYDVFNDLGHPHHYYYDYWEGTQPVKNLVDVGEIPGYPMHLLLTAPSPWLLGAKGFPDTLLSERWEVNVTSRTRGIVDEKDLYTGMMTCASTFGNTQEKIENAMLKDEMQILFNGTIGLNRINTILESDGLPTPFSDWDSYDAQVQLLLPRVYERLSDDEKASLLKPQTTSLNHTSYYPLTSDGQKSTLKVFVAMFGAPIRYNPETRSIDVDKKSISEAELSITLKPELTPKTTHDGLMKIRDIGTRLIKEAKIAQTPG